MSIFNKVSLTFRFVAWFMVVALLPLAVAGVISYFNAKDSLVDVNSQKLLAINKIKTNQIKLYLKERLNDVSLVSDLDDVELFVREINSIFIDELGSYNANGNSEEDIIKVVDSDNYKRVEKMADRFFATHIYDSDYTDLVLINLNGDVLYNFAKKMKKGINAFRDEFRGESAVEAIKRVKELKSPTFADFQFYPNFGNESAVFLADAIVSDDGVMVGYIAGRLLSGGLDNILNERIGLGETGQSYIVGKDYLMRSSSVFREDDTVLVKKVETDLVKYAFREKFGISYPEVDLKKTKYDSYKARDYRDLNVVGVYDSADLDLEFGVDFDWMVISEITENEIFRSVREMTLRVVYLVFVAIILAILFAWYAARKTSYTIKTPINELTKKMLTSFEDLSKSTKETSKIAEKNTTYADKTAKGAINQSAQANEFSSAVNDLSNGMEKMSKNAEQISEVALSSSKFVEETGERTKQIVGIINTITDIAEETNMLALNASIESSRAGEAGKGFSVVANEVGKLAESSAKSAKEVKKIINDVIKATKETVHLAGKVSGQNKELSAEINKYSEVIQGMAKNLTNITKVASENAKGAKNLSKSSYVQNNESKKVMASMQELQNLTGKLNKLVSSKRQKQ